MVQSRLIEEMDRVTIEWLNKKDFEKRFPTHKENKINLDIPIISNDEEPVHSQRWKGIMKCYPFTEERLAKWQPPYIIQPKLDGNRAVNKPITAGSILLSSEENQYCCLPHLTQQLMDSGLWKIPLDGEMYSHALFKEGGHELIHSIASASRVNIHPRHKEMEFWVFDVKTTQNQSERLAFIVNNLSRLPISIKVVPFWICETLSEVKYVYDTVIKDGFEGIVIRHLFNKYEEKRSTWVMKFKPKKKDKYKIIGWNEEVSIHGVPKGRIGSLVLSSQAGDTFAVSAGLDDNDRERLWNIKDELAGKDAIVHYQHLTNKHIPKGCFDIEVL